MRFSQLILGRGLFWGHHVTFRLSSWNRKPLIILPMCKMHITKSRSSADLVQWCTPSVSCLGCYSSIAWSPSRSVHGSLPIVGLGAIFCDFIIGDGEQSLLMLHLGCRGPYIYHGKFLVPQNVLLCFVWFTLNSVPTAWGSQRSNGTPFLRRGGRRKGKVKARREGIMERMGSWKGKRSGG